jgi:glucokinase
MSARYIVGIDLGGTNIVAGCVREDGGDLRGHRTTSTGAEEGPDAVVRRIIACAQESVAELRATVPGAEVIGAGCGSPGPLDTRTGVVLLTPNLGWVNMPLRERLRQGLGLRTALDNDANCAVLGEWWRGAARGTTNALGLTIGTGIGGGIIVGGKLYHGASDVAGEIGHMTIDANGRRCKCGNYGCVEAYASGPNIALRAVEAIESGESSTLPSYVAGDLRKITAQVVYEAAKAGDVLAQDVVRDTAHFLGAAVASLVNIFNPEAVVIMGGVTLAGDRLFEPLQREVTRRAFKPAVQVCRIVPGELSGVAGVYGAARAFQEQVEAGLV